MFYKYYVLARTSPGLTRSSFATTRNRVANDIRVPRKILRDTPDLSYVQPESNYYFKTSDSYQILKYSINISDLLDDSNFHRQTVVMTRLIEMIVQNPVFGIFCIISMLAHSTSQCLTNALRLQ
jgi:hypothetical protein